MEHIGRPIAKVKSRRKRKLNKTFITLSWQKSVEDIYSKINLFLLIYYAITFSICNQTNMIKNCIIICDSFYWLFIYNLGPDRLAGPKALDPNNCRQQTL